MLAAEVPCCAVWEQWHRALDTVSGCKHVPWVHLPAPPYLSRTSSCWPVAKGSQARGCDLRGAAGGQGWDSPSEMLSSCCLISANGTCGAGLGSA